MKIAYVHDWLVNEGGSEKVLKCLLDLNSGPIFTLFKGNQISFANQEIHSSFLQKIPGIQRYYRNLLPLFPFAMRCFDLSDFELIISSSHCVAKTIPIQNGQKHICYCHTPMRYAWQMQFAHMSFLKKIIANPLLIAMRNYDQKTTQKVDHFIANSTHVAARIQKYYGRDSTVIFPPVDTHLFSIAEQKENYYFTCARLVPYKRIDLLIDAFKFFPKLKLWIAGEGPEKNKLIAKAPKNVSFLGYLPDQKYREVLSKARAFLHAGEEDFGIALAEAQSAGIPVIAYGVGGSCDIIIPEKTGLFFHKQTIQDLCLAIEIFEQKKENFDACSIKEHAELFSRRNFAEKIDAFIRYVC